MPKKLLPASKELAKITTKVKQTKLTPVPLKKDFLVKELENASLYDAQPFHRIGHWNVNGIRAVLKKDSFINYIKERNFDILCFNETKIDKLKLQEGKIYDHELWKSDYNQYWSFSTAKIGYSGVAILTKPKPLSYEFGIDQETFDFEGRTVTVEYPDFFLVAVYVPNAGPECARLAQKIAVWELAFQKHLDKLRATKHVMVVGDLNVAYEPIDLHNPKGNEGAAGYTVEERQAFGDFLKKGFKDTYRVFHPEKVQYTYFSNMHKARLGNRGWRIDYCMVNEEAIDRIEESIIRDDILGSDHVPIEVLWRTSSQPKEAPETEPNGDNKITEESCGKLNQLNIEEEKVTSN